MSDAVSLLMHSSNIVVGERMAIGFMLVVLIGMFTYREHRKSTIYLAATIGIETIRLLADSMAFSYDIHGGYSIQLMQIAYFFSYTFGFVTLIGFSCYVRSFIEERTSIGKWVFRIPVVAALIGFVILCVAIFSGTVYAPVDGKMTVVGATPTIVQLIQFALAIYYPCAAFTKRKEIGIKAVMLLGIFGIIPMVVMFINFDYSMMFSAYSLVIVYILLQCDTSVEKEKQRKQLEVLNVELTEANDEKLAQIEEISSLNTQLEDNQTQLEEAAAEQEAQLEEVTALNAALEEQKQELLEANEKQEFHLNEIQRLNELFKKTQDHGIRSLLDQVIKRDVDFELINHLVKTVGEYFEADRAYIFQRDQTGQYTVNTHEWCAEGITPEKDNLQEVPINVVDPWIAEFRKKGSFYITCDDVYAKKEPIVYEVLEPQGITSLMAAPMLVNGDIIGFLGVDNPKVNIEHELYLSVAATAINHERQIIQEREREELYRKELEVAREAADAANNAKTAFLFNMSHDIRTPMNAILGFTQLIGKDGPLSEQQKDHLQKIENSGQYLLSIINNVLDMARIESGKVELDESFTDLLCEDNKTDVMLSSEIMKKNLIYTSSIDVKHRYVYADTAKTMQVTMNLLSNAIKYTPEGGKIHCDFREIDCDRAGYARFVTTIRDTGIGMSREFLDQIFDSFTREKTSTENKVIGTGLGMAIVKRLVDLMGGTIEVQSEPGEGTTFVIVTDFRIVENPEVYLERKAPKRKENINLEGKRVLLAEDNELNAEIAGMVLEETGIAVEYAADGVICVDMIEKAEAGYYDVVLMDIQMPNLNGYDATRRIRQLRDPAKAGIPIIAMTANAFAEDKREAMKAGMNGHLAKPINVSELMKALAETLE